MSDLWVNGQLDRKNREPGIGHAIFTGLIEAGWKNRDFMCE